MKRFLPLYSSYLYTPVRIYRRPVLVSFTILLFVLNTVALQAQDAADAYKKVVIQRAEKIVAGMVLADGTVKPRLTECIAMQYVNLNTIHETRNNQIKTLKASAAAETDKAAGITRLEKEAEQQLAVLHTQYIGSLQAMLTADQVAQVKDGMTYNVFSITWSAYQDMLPGLTAEQKGRIYQWLLEARELAMDAESSEKKHGVFGKYKGKINNYLSAQGLDMKKEGEAWQERIKEKKKNENTGN